MRSRYTAHVRAAIDYIIETHDPETRHAVDRDQTERWARQSRWQGLTIVGTQAGGPDDQTGTVEFIARFKAQGRDHVHHELSRFRRAEGRWYFIDGSPPKGTPTQAAPRVGRNAPCPCGSGKKFKLCHGP